MESNKYLTVSVINRYLKDVFDRNEHLRTVFLKGEISNFKGHTTGHLYFSLKDENSRINAIMFSSYAKKLNFEIRYDRALFKTRIFQDLKISAPGICVIADGISQEVEYHDRQKDCRAR